ncbi:phage capsid scaffolding protein [Pectobacterium brasiliense]|uniref:GPO family capsid scaffolding protein n=1 Tax=Pectobacterium brasiliense TaxID=180957 RepID=UPI00057FD331|nr:GPO family capsid scaffolding protein [Pectobacterium brasiliense]KHS93245.1 phage capsid scaffolding protein [Pectobacterium brasiliense]
MPISKPFLAAVEGATCDGRTLERVHISQMAKNFNKQVRGARVNLEHIRGYSPTSDFRAYGDVEEVSEFEIQDGPLKGKLALQIKIDATDDLVALNTKRQKIYPSIEIHPSFADTGEAYLMGLGMTDDPASLGVGILEFNAKCGGKGPLDGRKTSPECFFTAADTPITLEFEDNAPTGDAGKNFFSRITELLTGSQQRFSKENGELKQAVELIAQSQRDLLDKTETFSALQKQNTELKGNVETLSKSLTELKEQLAGQDGNFSQRPPAAGGDKHSGVVLADC